jgi:hypothetical protein
VSELLAARARLLEALETAGLRTATTGRMSAPVVLVEPGDPWSEPQRLPGRVSRWRLTAIAGRPDSEGALEELAGTIDTIDTALRTLRGCELPTWARPLDTTLEGVPYAATIATVQLPSS